MNDSNSKQRIVNCMRDIRMHDARDTDRLNKFRIDWNKQRPELKNVTWLEYALRHGNYHAAIWLIRRGAVVDISNLCMCERSGPMMTWLFDLGWNPWTVSPEECVWVKRMDHQRSHALCQTITHLQLRFVECMMQCLCIYISRDVSKIICDYTCSYDQSCRCVRNN
jgi:hypothetical protein